MASTYLMAWSVYGIGVLLFLAGFVWLTRRWRPLLLRDLLWVLALGTLLPFATSAAFEGHWAPAFVVAVFEVLFQPDGDPAGALAALVVGWGAALLLLVVVSGLRLVLGGRRAGG